MSVKSFKFVSPGVFINEIDNSQLPRLPDQLGPVLIGRSERGPSMVPVQVDSFSEFVEVFGEPIGGGESEDTWRNGNRMGPTYAAFAAQAYLSSSSPVTFVRLLGTESDAADVSGKAGWEMDNASLITLTGTNDESTPYAIVYHTSDITSVTASATDLKEFQISMTGAGSASAASPASRTLEVAATFSDKITANHLDSGDSEISFNLSGKSDANAIKVTFTLDLQNQYAGTSLKVGLAGGISPEKVAEKIAQAINSVGNTLSVTATSSGRIVTIINDEAGEISPLAGGNEADAAHHIILGLTNETIDAAAQLVVGGTAQNGADAEAAGDKVFTVSTDPNSKKYIRSVLNTNPTLVNTDITEAPEKYFLGPTFDQALNRTIDFSDGEGISNAAAADQVNKLKKFRTPASPAATPWIISQSLSDVAQFNKADLTRLFKIHALYSGEWEQKNFKVSITDISVPRNSYTKYGTFSLEIRRVSDSDSNPQVVERFTGLTLDPASPSYIGAKIGDMQLIWKEEEGRYIEYGTHKNVSKFIRVEVATDVATGAANPELLPFGYDVLKDPAGPSLCLRLSTKGSSKLSQPGDAYFGITTDKTHAGDATEVAFEVTDSSYCDMVRTISTDALVVQELFSLDFVKNDADGFPAYPTEGTDVQKATGALNGTTGDYATVLSSIDKFTIPLQGGFDGLNILDIEPFNSTILNDAATPTSSYAYYSVKRAIDSVSDPEFVECNMMAIPGISNPGLTGQLIDVCEKRADALAVIDLEDDYCPSGWDKRPEEDRLPKVTDALRNLKDRAINSSYGCAYYPWVQIRDNIGNKLVWVPPSVAAIGTMSSAAANSELWFAPAGFTRGGLTSGSAGLPVIQTRYRLSSKQRDKLYEANVNPIAQFPAEGIVIFGQKTLQVTPSALDRINVRRLMIFVKKEISRMASTLLFDQNVDVTWSRFKSRAEPFLTSVKARFGLTEYRIILDETTTTPDLIDRNIMYAKIFLKPARAIEFIAIDFVITNSGASFDD